MNRRKFVQSAAVSGAALGGALAFSDAAARTGNAHRGGQQWYELRTYFFTAEAQRQLTGSYLEHAYIPAMNRAGIRPIGVFSELQAGKEGGGHTIGSMVTLTPFDSIESLVSINERLIHDTDYIRAGEPYLSAAPSSPGYDRIESALLKAFVHMPRIEMPEKKERLFELRRYESPSEAAGQKKIEMFNTAGEIDIFKKIGARPVFFGETMIGPRRPNLTYMLCFDDMEGHDAKWKAFGSDPEWKKISAIPEYSDARLISSIVRTFLSPAAYSQI